jgi:hypothetical protein
MLVKTFVSTIWTYPEPTILLVLDGLDEVLAHFVRCCLRVAVFALDHISQLFLVPLGHAVLLLCLLLVFFVSVVRVQTPLLSLALHVGVVRELAFLALFAIALLEKLTENGLGVDTEWNLLNLDGFEELGDFFAGLLGGRFFFLFLELFGRFLLLVGGASRGGGVDLLNLSLRGSTLFIFHAKGLVDGDLLHLGLLALAFWRHLGWCRC